MNYLPFMTDDEIKYICSVIPPKIVLLYFQRHPKAFSKVFPGFRPNAIRFNIPDLLFKHRNCDFISSFIEDHIRHWLPEIREYLNQCIEEGASKDAAYIRTLPQSFFAGNVPLYFKLIEEKHPEDYISLLSSAVMEAKKVSEEQEKLEDEVKAKETTIEGLQSELNSITIALKNSKAKQSEYAVKIESLKQEVGDVDKLKALLQSREEAIRDLKSVIIAYKKTEKNLKVELSALKDYQQQLKTQIREELEKQQVEKRQTAALKPRRPIDMDEFKEYLGYNLKDIGVSASSDCFLLLKQHLCSILFQGMPIIINRSAGVPLMKCIANTLVGNTNVVSLTYNKDISAQEIEAFLSEDARVLCLDCFLGNYSETELLTLLERHRNKIIFLTLAYDRTLRFVPYEIFRYCYYLNLNRIQTFSANGGLTEDPSVFEETEVDNVEPNPDTRYSPLLKEMIGELGFSPSLTENKCAHISNEQDLCCALAFDILPYCTDVLQIVPFAVSDRLVKYAGDRGRCSYKKLFMEWFA